MDDERMLSEALRAHAAGGVSTPRATPPPSETPSTASTGSTDATTGRSRRFRPLGRRRNASTTGTPTTGDPTVRADVPAPRSGGLAAPPPAGTPFGPPRPMPPRMGPPPGGPRPGPGSGPVPTYGPYAPGPQYPPPAVAPADGPGTWDATTVAWWGLVSLLAGGSVGAAIGVLSLLLPA